MPACLFEAYCEQMQAVTAERLLLVADGALYAQLTADSGKKWRASIAGLITPIRRPQGGARNGSVPYHRSSLFFWRGQAIAPDALKQRLQGHLKRGFSGD